MLRPPEMACYSLGTSVFSEISAGVPDPKRQRPHSRAEPDKKLNPKEE
jgi:hypothetical protein